MKFVAKHMMLVVLVLAAIQVGAQNWNASATNRRNSFPNSLELQVKNSIELFPNPVEDFLQVKILNSELQDVKFEMHSIIGNVVHIETEEVSTNTYRIPVESFASGYYFLVIKDDVTRFNKAMKFLKKD